MTTPEGAGSDPLREAAEEIRRESQAAAAEIRNELDAAGRETREGLREAMTEIRAAFRDIWGPAATEPSSTASATRLSRAERKEMTRELLLDAAIEVFAQKGYHGASLDDVAEAAGFTKGAVYSNFTRKSDLFRELLERETRRRGAALGAGIEAVPLALWPDLAGEWLGRQAGEQRDWDILTVEFWLAAVRDPGLRDLLCRGREETLAGFASVIDRKLQEAGVDPGLTGRDLFVLLDALGTGLLMNHYLEPGAGQAELFAKALRKLLAAASGED
jgi:AcrR family transcriptional regulator